MLGDVSGRDSIEGVGEVTRASNGDGADGDDGVVLSRLPKWVT